MSGKKKPPNDLNLPFIEKKEGGERRPQLSGLWTVLMFGGPWKVPMFGGQWKEKEKHPFHLFSLPPQQILLKPFFFPINLKVLLYHGSKSLLTHFLLFLWPINNNHAFWCNKSSTHSLRFDFDWIFFSFPWICGITGLKLHKWMKNRLRSHP